MTLLQRLMPDFLGIGAQRAGTTWLWVHLRRHPQIWTPRRKELHFFDRTLGNGAEDRLARMRYAAWFLPGRLVGRVVGEVTPAYAVLPDERVALIASWMPSVRIVYLLRDPIERAWSQAAKAFPAWAGQPLEQAREDALLAFFDLPEVRTRSDYLSAVRTWRRHFPAEQFLAVVSEQLLADPVAQLQNLFAFLRVDPDVPLDAGLLRRRVHAGRTPPIPAGVRTALETRLYAQQADLESIVGMALPWGR